MKRFRALICVMGLWVNTTQATHIVGGEFQLDHLSGNQYNLFLNLYFDDVNGNPDAEDPEIQAYIYSKANNQLISSILLPKLSESQVPYTNPSCTNGQLRTRLLRYGRGLILEGSIYNQSTGYYVVWERCCRNGTISNIVSPGDVGMAFYLEFPAVRQNGSNFFNSSPVFAIPVGDYLCLNEPVSFAFGATDPDGDQLVYSLATPLAGNSGPDPDLIIPPPAAGPYAPVQWLPGYNAQTAIPHDVAFPQNQFQVNAQTGLLSVVPIQQGLFVFSVRCEEFRNGVKIGEVRRDFQLLVLDCPQNNAPSLQAQTGQSGNTPVFYEPGQTISLDASTGNLCFDIWLKDPDPNELLRLSLLPRNFVAQGNYLSLSQGVVNGPNDSLRVQFCWPACVFSEMMPGGSLSVFEFDLIVADNRCPAPDKDTLRVRLVALPVVENPPVISTNAPAGDTNCEYLLEKIVEELFTFEVFAQDLLDNDFLELSAEGRGFQLADYGMQFTPVSGLGAVQSRFTWSSDCRAVADARNEFVIDFLVKDQGFCEDQTRKVCVKLVLLDKPIVLEGFLPPNAFTPNGDSFNPTFQIPNLPEENCRFRFRSIEIYNRWGSLVYRSTDRNFAWDGGDFPPGIYFYYIDYFNEVYRGTVSLIK
ncbi:MAG: gliding motility-associated C-terminal domain-containing protein [Microscillaceae bacterium]|nr:gliding motility-associated C-terminal domain-containing protein [Microscillaceae bacterium]